MNFRLEHAQTDFCMTINLIWRPLGWHRINFVTSKPRNSFVIRMVFLVCTKYSYVIIDQDGHSFPATLWSLGGHGQFHHHHPKIYHQSFFLDKNYHHSTPSLPPGDRPPSPAGQQAGLPVEDRGGGLDQNQAGP